MVRTEEIGEMRHRTFGHHDNFTIYSPRPKGSSGKGKADPPSGGYSPDWGAKLSDVLSKLAATGRFHRELIALRGEVAKLKSQVASLGESGVTATDVIQSFAPEPYDVLRPIHVTVTPTDEGDYTARIGDANLTAYGDNPHLAVNSLKFMILDTFDSFTAAKKLGAGPAKQLAVLKELIKKRG